jgi:hypothetical protein
MEFDGAATKARRARDASNADEFVDELNRAIRSYNSAIDFLRLERHPGDVAENRDFISLSHEMEIPMAEIARNVGYVDQLSLRQFKRWNQRIRFIDFINVPIFPSLDFVVKNIGTFLVALVMTALMIHFSPRKAIIFLIPTMVILALAIAMT